MAITAELVKQLREQTGAGMMDCKKALTETDGDFEKATTLLRERGVAIAAKREGRAASEGVIASSIADDAQIAVMLEMNCETTFVAKTDEFIKLAANIADHVAHIGADACACSETSCLVEQKYFREPEITIAELINRSIAKLGEKSSVARFIRLDVGGCDHTANGVIGCYVHMGNQIGVLVELDCESETLPQNEAMAQLARDIAMHVSWSNPDHLCREDVPQDAVEKERDVHRQWAVTEGKPEKVIEKIVDGRMKEYYSRTCLLEQPYVKDQEQTITDLLDVFQKDAGEKVGIKRFVRFRVGETTVG